MNTLAKEDLLRDISQAEETLREMDGYCQSLYEILAKLHPEAVTVQDVYHWKELVESWHKCHLSTMSVQMEILRRHHHAANLIDATLAPEEARQRRHNLREPLVVVKHAPSIADLKPAVPPNTSLLAIIAVTAVASIPVLLAILIYTLWSMHQ